MKKLSEILNEFATELKKENMKFLSITVDERTFDIAKLEIGNRIKYMNFPAPKICDSYSMILPTGYSITVKKDLKEQIARLKEEKDTLQAKIDELEEKQNGRI
jgi:hypothetical protein